MKTRINLLQEVKYKFWELLSHRCNHCPFAGSDWSDYNETGFIGCKCELHPKNECEGCLTPAVVIFIRYQQYKKEMQKSADYEYELLQQQKQYEDEIHQIIADDKTIYE